MQLSTAQSESPAEQVEVNTPEEHMGDVIGDLNSRRGLIGEFIDKPANMKLVKASVPLSEMFQYVSTLRGMTKGALSPFILGWYQAFLRGLVTVRRQAAGSFCSGLSGGLLRGEPWSDCLTVLYALVTVLDLP